ncbi:hypothetical protein [Aneurinibacillus sp. REN35]|uniref:hypothetical protein n=1 Tax=Aneurinibacillus sp. REN35 TaxID=3237286 RepID=UPI003527AC65
MKKEMNGTLLSAKSFFKGTGAGALGAALSTKDSLEALVKDPVGTAQGVVAGVWKVVSNPKESLNNLSRDLEGLYYQMKDGGWETRGQLVGSYVTSALLDKGVGKVLKVTPNSKETPKLTQGMDKVKFSTNNLPKDSKELINNGWKDVTPEGMAKNTSSREFIDPETGMKVRFDPGKLGTNGFEGKDHYHVHNPNSTGKKDYHLDIKGNLVLKGSKASHIEP